MRTYNTRYKQLVLVLLEHVLESAFVGMPPIYEVAFSFRTGGTNASIYEDVCTDRTIGTISRNKLTWSRLGKRYDGSEDDTGNRVINTK